MGTWTVWPRASIQWRHVVVIEAFACFYRPNGPSTNARRYLGFDIGRPSCPLGYVLLVSSTWLAVTGDALRQWPSLTFRMLT